MTQASQGYAGRRRLGKPGFDPPPGIRTVEDITAKCPGCGGNAYVEEFESYRPDQAALVKRITRCAKLQWKERCAPTTEIIEKESTTVPLISSELKARYLSLDKTTRKKKILTIPGIEKSAGGFLNGSTRLSQDKIDQIEEKIIQIEAEQQIDVEPEVAPAQIDVKPEEQISQIDVASAPEIEAKPVAIFEPEFVIETKERTLRVDSESGKVIETAPKLEKPAQRFNPLDVWHVGQVVQVHLNEIASLLHPLDLNQRELLLLLASDCITAPGHTAYKISICE